jgi:trans-feruloyl-CoA hydratase/vanillin synthase
MALAPCYDGFRHLRLDYDDAGILSIVLQRPEKRNAIGVVMTHELVRVFDMVACDDLVKVVVISGAGNSFSAGMDLKEMFDASAYDAATLHRARHATNEWRTRSLRQLPQTTIAKVHGFCLGGALPLVESCDIAFCSVDAVFGIPETNFGFFPGGPIAKTLLKGMPRRAAAYYALSGRTFTGQDAAAMGLTTAAFDAERLDAETWSLACEIAARAAPPARLAESMPDIRDGVLSMPSDISAGR